MAMNGLVTKSHANLVQNFRVWGAWNETGADDFAKGRVPDNTMMLNIVLRAAMDKMIKLQSFSWELDCKPLKTMYQGLAMHNTLTRLTLKFPNTRIPRPAVIIPPMANLRAFRAEDIDPLCYPDDISVLLLSSKKLEDLRLHFSPRMRQEAESSLSWNTYFGRCLRVGYKLPLKHFGIQNFYGPNIEGLSDLLDSDIGVSATFLDVFGGTKGASANVFLDETWKHVPPDMKTNFKRARTNEPAPQHVQLMSNATGMEKLYIVSTRISKTGHTPDDAGQPPVTPDDSQPDVETVALGKQYIHAITRQHGSTMKHLLLWDQWHLDQDDIRELIRYCPNLEQLGIGVASEHSLRAIHLLLPFLPKLEAVRMLLTDELEGECTSHGHLDEMGTWFAKLNATSLKYIGVGKRTFKVGPLHSYTTSDGKQDVKAEVTEVKIEDVKHVEIWGLDCLDLTLDPVAPFSP
jgi:hypothetical protein